MTTALLQTNLYIPPLRPDNISRPRLTGYLDESLDKARALSLISAPAGYGKTTILVEWIQQRQLPVAWISVDKYDNEPARFFDYLFSAISGVDQRLGESLSQPPPGQQAPSPIELMTGLINAFATAKMPGESEQRLILVLDDYHLRSKSGKAARIRERRQSGARPAPPVSRPAAKAVEDSGAQDA